MIDPNNPRRFTRAIQIATALGKVPILKLEPRYSPIIFGIKPVIQDLRFKIHERLCRRVRQGLVAEVQKLHTIGLSWKRMFDLGLEYRFISLYLRGKFTKQDMLIKLETEINHYAKRQMTWWKRDDSIIWLTVSQVNRLDPSLFLQIRSLLHADAGEVL